MPDSTIQRFKASTKHMSYIELHACSAFSFLRGASFPEQLAETAAELEMPALALLDRNGVYGAQRFSVAAREQNIRPIIGCELSMEDGGMLPVLVENRTGYRNLCELLTQAHLRSEKGQCAIQWSELPLFAEGLIAFLGSARVSRVGDGVLAIANTRDAQFLINTFGRDNVFVEIQRHFLRGEERTNRQLLDLANHYRLPLVATNGVQYAKSYGREVLDVFTCIREHTHLDVAGKLLTQNSERHLKSEAEMRELFRDLPEAIENTSRLAARLTFSLENLGYEFPEFPVPAGHSMDSFLCTITWFGAQQRYAAISTAVKRKLEEELALISKLEFPGYFLIVWDIVNFCREHNIMVQGRGSAANSAVCYCLGITPVDPVSSHLVFERFLNESRKERRSKGGCDPGNLSPLWQTRGGHDRERHHLSRPERRAGNRQGVKFFAEHSGSLLTLVRERRFSAHTRSPITDRAGWFAQGTSAHAGFRQAISGDLRFAAASWPAFRRDDYLPEQAELVCAAGERVDAGARRGAMG